MDWLHNFLQLNHGVILFIYGLTFFVLGLAIMLQSRRYSQLELARSLSWLAAFGLLHGLHEWGDFFIPIQRAYLSDPILMLLGVIQLLLLAGSFACLLEFGISVQRPGRHQYAFYTIPAILLIGWIMLAFFIVLPLAPDLTSWYRETNALARYFIGFPGALLAAYSLRQQALQRVSRLNVPHIVRMLRIAGLALGMYALVGGLIPPPVSFFPGNWLNTDTFEDVVGFPPLIVRSGIGLMLAIAIIRALEVFELETDRFIESMEQRHILSAERDRIARELHDGVIQKVYTAGLLIDSAYKQAEANTLIATRLDKASTVLNDAIADLRRNLSELRAAPSGLDLSDSLRQLAQDPRFQSLVDISLDIQLPEGETLETTRADNVLAIIHEALSNSVRHARAHQVEIGVKRMDGRLQVCVLDNGIGLARDYNPGFGLRNMRDRARLLGGEIEITGIRGKGTTVALDIPWRDVQ